MISFSAIAAPGHPFNALKFRSRPSPRKQILLMTVRRLANGSYLFRCYFRRLNRPAQFLPGAETALDMGDGFQPHALGGLRGQRRAQAAGAEEHEALVLREDRLVILALRIDPEFQEPARAMERARHPGLAVELANIADVDQHDVRLPVQLDG